MLELLASLSKFKGPGPAISWLVSQIPCAGEVSSKFNLDSELSCGTMHGLILRAPKGHQGATNFLCLSLNLSSADAKH